MINIAGYEIEHLEFPKFKLDGGAMFGSVPKNIWSKRIHCDEENRIPLATRCLFIKKGNRKILVDCGCGEKWNDKLRSIYAIEESAPLPLPFQNEEITDLVLTHLHFDHAGGVSYINQSGELKLTFPNAKIYVQEANYLNAKNPSLRERASYLPENVEPIESANLELIKGDTEIFPGFFGRIVNGHTKGQQIIEIKDNDNSLLYPTDLVPTSRHLPLPFTMGYDICTETVMKEKEEFLNYALKKEAIILFEHDPDTPAVKIKIDDKGHFAVREVLEL